MKTRMLGMLLAVVVLSHAASMTSVHAEVDDQALALETAALFRAARGVISKNQALINDPARGDKGLGADAVVEQALSNYQAATGHALAESDDLAGEARTAMLDAVRSVMRDAQPLINEQGKGFKGFLPAVFAKQVADNFSVTMNEKMFIKLTAPQKYVRNRANRPDDWEKSIIETKFTTSSWPKNQHFSAVADRKGRAAFRLLLPEYYGQSCLGCHGEPAGEPDITGGSKEGGTLGELGGAISVGIYK